jgi:uncharacterized protein
MRTDISFKAPSWRNEVTLNSIELLNEYEPAYAIDRISPTPLLMIVAKKDTVTVPDLVLRAYERALQPKQLMLLDCGHFDPYLNEFPASSSAAVEWFKQHL